jgi:hypothetical protein
MHKACSSSCHTHNLEHLLLRQHLVPPCTTAASFLAYCPAAGFFFPECFLIAVLQSHALQAGGQAIDRLALAQVVLSSAPRPSCIESPPAVGVYVHGLYLEGARQVCNEHMDEEATWRGRQTNSLFVCFS